MALLPRTQRAIVGHANATVAISYNVPLPEHQPDMVIVKTVAVALNPVDAKVAYSDFCTPEAISGCDFAGHVVAVGSAVKKPLKIGDRVCGAVHGMNPSAPLVGAFTEYVGATGDILLSIPVGMSFEAAATLGTGVGTIGMALFWSLGLPGSPSKPFKPRPEKKPHVLVYGGSSASGTMAIQLVRLSGLIPITTCSPSNFDLVKSFGAEATFDYRSGTCSNDIRAYTKNSLQFAIDCITTSESMKLCYAAIGRVKGRYTALDPFPMNLHTRPTLTPDWVLGPALLGNRITWPAPYDWDAKEELRLWAQGWFADVQTLLDQGRLKSHPYRTGEKGLDGVIEGLETLRKREVSGVKLVYRVA